MKQQAVELNIKETYDSHGKYSTRKLNIGKYIILKGNIVLKRKTENS